LKAAVKSKYMLFMRKYVNQIDNIQKKFNSCTVIFKHFAQLCAALRKKFVELSFHKFNKKQ